MSPIAPSAAPPSSPTHPRTRCCGSSGAPSRSPTTSAAAGCSSATGAGCTAPRCCSWSSRSSPPTSPSRSIRFPAAFAVTRDPVVIWTANAFALLGLGSLLVLVELLVRRLRYLDETIALILGFVGIKILAADLVHISDLASLAIIAALLAGGTVASLVADRLDPPHPAEEATRRPPRCPGELTPPAAPTSRPGVGSSRSLKPGPDGARRDQRCRTSGATPTEPFVPSAAKRSSSSTKGAR